MFLKYWHLFVLGFQILRRSFSREVQWESSRLGHRLEYDYAGMSFDGSVFVTEARRSISPVSFTASQIHSWRYLRVKRWIDVGGSLIMILLSLVPGLLIACLIALTSKGSIFYRETRIGRGGRPFRIWKFRSMCQAAEWQDVVKAGTCDGAFLHWRVHKNLRDPRITVVGGFLRRWSLPDELPQLLKCASRQRCHLLAPARWSLRRYLCTATCNAFISQPLQDSRACGRFLAGATSVLLPAQTWMPPMSKTGAFEATSPFSFGLCLPCWAEWARGNSLTSPSRYLGRSQRWFVRTLVLTNHSCLQSAKLPNMIAGRGSNLRK